MSISIQLGRFLRELLVVGVMWGGPAASQEVSNWRDFEFHHCGRCKLQLTEVARLGDAVGPGLISVANPAVSWSKDVGYLVSALTSVQIFDDSGRFVRTLGRQGEGPGEFRGVIDAHLVDGSIVALDHPKRAWVVYDKGGGFVVERRYGLAHGPFVPVGGSRVVVIAVDRRPSVVGYPLHLVDVNVGTPSLHFGFSGTWLNTPYATTIVGSVTSRQGTVWWGTAASPRVEEWTLDNELVRSIEGNLPWFAEVTEDIDPTREEPSTLLKSIALDHEGHLWLSLETADPDWRDVPREVSGAEGAVVIPPDRWDDYLDTRLDIFDLNARRFLGSHIWDSQNVRLMDLDGEPAVSVLAYTETMVPQVVIYRVRPAPAP